MCELLVVGYLCEILVSCLREMLVDSELLVGFSCELLVEGLVCWLFVRVTGRGVGSLVVCMSYWSSSWFLGCSHKVLVNCLV